MPVKWQSDLSAVFSIVVYHKYTPETFGFDPNIPTLRQTAIVGRSFDQIPMFASRMEPSHENDSGWFIGSEFDGVDGNDPTQLEVISLYEAMLKVPHLLRFLSLPIRCQVVFRTERPVVLYDYQELESPRGSYLDLALNSDA